MGRKWRDQVWRQNRRIRRAHRRMWLVYLADGDFRRMTAQVWWYWEDHIRRKAAWQITHGG